MNRCTSNGVHELTPYEIFVGRKSILSHLKVFGIIVNVRIPNENREKFDAKSEKCILIGNSSAKKAYKCFNPLTWAVRISHDVIYKESTSWYKPDAASSNPIKEALNAIMDAHIQPNPLPKEMSSSIKLNGLQEPSSIPSTSQPLGGLSSVYKYEVVQMFRMFRFPQ